MTRTTNPLSRRCPRLGGPVDFGYCMRGELDRPCFQVVDCWWETFDIVRYLQDHLPEAQRACVMNARPAPKVASLVEMIAQAKERMQT
jgi:hypothetical protein